MPAAPRSNRPWRRRPPSRPNWRPCSPRTRRGSPPPRTPGTSCRRWRNGCAARCGWRWSAGGTSRPRWTPAAPGGTRKNCSPRPRRPPPARRNWARAWGRPVRCCRRPSSVGNSSNSGCRRPNGSTWPPSGPSPTGGRASPSSPARSTRCAARAPPPPTRSNASPTASRRPWPVPRPPRRSWSGPAPRAVSRTPTTRPCANGTTARWRRTRPPRPGWRSWSRPNGPRNARSPRRRRAWTRCR